MVLVGSRFKLKGLGFIIGVESRFLEVMISPLYSFTI